MSVNGETNKFEAEVIPAEKYEFKESTEEIKQSADGLVNQLFIPE